MGSVPKWKTLIFRSLKQNRSARDSKYVQVATIRKNGRPANRTVVFRDFHKDTDFLTFVTDSRSGKIEDITNSPWGEICWYFPVSREQFRLMGTMFVVKEGDSHDEEWLQARQAAWTRMSAKGQEQFFWPTPGNPRENDDLVQGPITGEQHPAPATFCLVVMDIQEVDHLQLKANRRHKFWRTSKDEDFWEEQEMNP